MKKIFLLTILISGLAFAQTSSKALNRDLNAMKSAFLNKDFETFVEYIYPKSFEKAGGKSNVINMMRMMYAKIGKDISIQSVTYKNPGKAIQYKSEIQQTLDEESVINTPKGIQKNTSKMIAISIDKGKNWKFINTLNQSKENLFKMFPNLSPDLEINPIVQKSKIKQ